MTRRRDHGTGSIYKRSSDGLYVGTLEAGYTEKGTRRRITVSGKNEAAVKKKLRERRLQLDQHGDSGVSARANVKAWADEWIQQQEKTLRPSSYTATKSALTKWIIPTIGHRRFDLLTPKDLRAVAQKQRDAGRSTSTEARTHSVLISLLKAATLEGYPVPPRLLLVKGSAVAVSDRQDMSVNQAVAVLEQASYLPHGSRYLAAFLEGMRQGESLGLTWDAIDFQRNQITLSWQLQSLRYRERYNRDSGFRTPDGFECRQLDGTLHLVRPKTRAGWRVIPMVAPMRAALLAWRDAAPASQHGLVWPNLDGKPTYYKTDDTEWYGLQNNAQVGHPAGRYYGIHEARHTTATLLLAADVPAEIITRILGHSTWASSQAYAHVSQEMAHAALTRATARLTELN